MLVVLSLSSHCYAKDVIPKTMSHSQMTLKEKNLLSRKSMLKNKLHAWQEYKKSLIKNFKDKYDTDTSLGRKNYYGKLRQQQHTKDFYTSLKSKDDEIEQKLLDTNRQLKMLKKRFYQNTRISQNY